MQSNTSLLVMVHGSPKPEANGQMFDVVGRVRERGLFRSVHVGFMECNEPTIPDAIAACVKDGAQRVVAVPYFLHMGTHVADDLPTILEEAQRTYPGVHFDLGQYLGMSPKVTDVLIQRAGDAVRN